MSLWVSLFREFLIIGSTSFGGYMSMIVQVRKCVVERYGWLSNEDFLRGLSLATVLPGPVAVNMAAWCGYQIKGWVGALLVLVSVLMPSVTMMIGFSMVYYRVKEWDRFEPFVSWVGLVVVAVIFSTALRLVSEKGKFFPGLDLGWIRWLTFMLSLCWLILMPGYLPIVSLLMLVILLGQWVSPPVSATNESSTEVSVFKERSQGRRWMVLGTVGIITACFFLLYPNLFEILVVFGRLSLSLFGGGYVVVPLLKSELVESFGWISASDLLLGVSLGQLTPGPILVSVVFFGFKISGVPGAFVAVVGMFLPTAVLLILMANYSGRFLGTGFWKRAEYLLRPAVAAIVLASGWLLIEPRVTMWDVKQWAFLLISIMILHLTRIHTAWMVFLALLLSMLPL